MSLDESRVAELRQRILDNTENLTRLRVEQAALNVYVPRPAPESVPTRQSPEFYEFVARTLGDSPLHYLEFGVCGGKSLRLMLELFRNPHSRFTGFDCFEGLPEAWQDKPAGSFSMKGKPPTILDKRATLIKGYFQDTLPQFVTNFDHPKDSPVLVHYDADLYSSTLFILCTLWTVIPEYYFIFDEFVSDEVVALYDFSRAFPVDFEFLCGTKPGWLPMKVFGKIKRRTAIEKLAPPTT